MKNHRIAGALIALSLFAPALALAQTTTGSSTVDVQIQSLLGQITSLQQQLKMLLQSVASSSVSGMWHASSTPPMGNSGSVMGGCPSFGRDLSEGARGSDVMDLQQMLSGDGFLTASSTGFFGPLTARALEAFQVHFGITASSSAGGFFGPRTRNFLTGRCGGGDGHGMGSSTPPMMHPDEGNSKNGSSTSEWSDGGQWMGTSTNSETMHGMMGSSTTPKPPCPNNSNLGASPALFISHVIAPMMPCNGEEGSGQGGGQDY